jgi:tetratricopeptide (TPR) repeat protein
MLALVGAGSSVRAGYPTWGQLIDSLKVRVLATHPDKSDHVEDLISGCDFLVLAAELRVLLGTLEYNTFMTEMFSPRQPSFQQFHKDLLRLPFRHILTTNYDPILELAHAAAFDTPAVAINASNAPDLGNFIQQSGISRGYGRRFHVHLHGRYDAPNSILLTEDDYQQRYLRSESVRSLLIAVLATQRVLSIGFSLADLDLMHLFRSVGAYLASPEPRHFAFLTLDIARQRPSAERQSLHRKYRIEPIFYEWSTDHRYLEILVNQLYSRLLSEAPRLFERREIDYVHRLPRAMPLCGRTAEIQTLHRLYEQSGSHVAIVTGVEGCGKSVLADAFLQAVFENGVNPPRVFVWSFHRNPSVSEFLRWAYHFATGQDLLAKGIDAASQLVEELKCSGSSILLLDGLEAVRTILADGEVRLLDDALCLVLRKTPSAAGHTFLLATARVSLKELMKGADHFELDVGRLASHDFASLAGPNGDGLGEMCSFHAQTACLLASLRTHPDPQELSNGSVQERMILLARRHLQELDETDLGLLYRMAQPLRPWASALLEEALIRAANDRIFPGLQVEELQERVARMLNSGLIDQLDGATRPLYVVVRLIATALFRDQDRLPESVRAAWDRHYCPEGYSNIGTRPIVDELRELVTANRPEDAFNLYRQTLRARFVEDPALGTDAIRYFFHKAVPRQPLEGLTENQISQLVSDMGLALHRTGRLDEATRWHEVSLRLDLRREDFGVAFDRVQLADVQLSRGSLEAARAESVRAIKDAEMQFDKNSFLLAHSTAAEVDLLLGNLASTLEHLNHASRMQAPNMDLKFLVGIPAIVYCKLLVRTRQWRTANKVVASNLEYCERWNRYADIIAFRLLLAEISLHNTNLEKAWQELKVVDEMAAPGGWQETLVRCSLLRARLHLASGSVNKAIAEAQRGICNAETLGFGILATDLLLESASLHRKDHPAEAGRLAKRALQDAEGQDYAWGILGSISLLAERGKARDATMRKRAAKLRQALKYPPS